MKKLTNREVIYNFKDFLDKERLSDQIGHSNRFIINHLLNFRASLLKRKKKEGKLSELNYQTYTINLVEVTDQELPCIPPSKCILLRTENSLPSYIDLKSITTPINKSGIVHKISEVDPDMIQYKLNSKIPAQSSNYYYYLQNTGKGVYVYVWTDDPNFLKAITIKGLFYQPYIIEAIKDCAGTLDPCYNYLNAEFPIDPELLTDVYALAINSLIRAKTVISDNYNEGNDTNVNNPNPTK
jgi:hypothetical protein